MTLVLFDSKQIIVICFKKCEKNKVKSYYITNSFFFLHLVIYKKYTIS